jgi:hypothetical protein
MMYLGQIVEDYIVEIGGDTLHDAARFYNFGIRALRELNNNQQLYIKTTLLQINPTTLTAPLPADCIAYTRIGRMVNNQIVPFGINNDMALNRLFDSCGNMSTYSNFPANAVPTDGLFWGSFPIYSPHTINGEMMGGYFGVGGGHNSNGYYRLDQERGLLQFSNVVTEDNIYFEYLADITCNEDGKIAIPNYFFEPVLAFIKWKHASKKGFTATDRAERERLWHISAHNALMNDVRMTKQEIVQAIRTNIKLSPKI